MNNNLIQKKIALDYKEKELEWCESFLKDVNKDFKIFVSISVMFLILMLIFCETNNLGVLSISLMIVNINNLIRDTLKYRRDYSMKIITFKCDISFLEYEIEQLEKGEQGE